MLSGYTSEDFLNYLLAGDKSYVKPVCCLLRLAPTIFYIFYSNSMLCMVVLIYFQYNNYSDRILQDNLLEYLNVDIIDSVTHATSAWY